MYATFLQVLRLREALPPRCALRDWKLLYSTTRHGLSINTLLRRVAGCRDTLLAIKDSGGHVFGAFLGAPWQQVLKPKP